MMNVKIKNGILITSILISMVLPVFADNNSIVEMELISDGTLDGTWTENTSLQWAAYDPGDGNYTYRWSSAVQYDLGWTINSDHMLNRSESFYMTMVNDDDTFAGNVFHYHNNTFWYGVMFTDGSAFIVRYNGTLAAWDGTDWDPDSLNWQLYEYSYMQPSSNLTNVKTIYDSYTGHLMWKAWCSDLIPDGNGEPTDWVIDIELAELVDSGPHYHGLLGYNAAAGSTYVVYAMYTLINCTYALDTNTHIYDVPVLQPKILDASTLFSFVINSMIEAFEESENMTERDLMMFLADFLMDFINWFDHSSYVYYPTGEGDQNDQIYVYSIVLRDFIDMVSYIGDSYGDFLPWNETQWNEITGNETLVEYINNFFVFMVEDCTDGTDDEDWMLIQFDSDHNHVYDDTDYSFVIYGNSSDYDFEAFNGSSYSIPLFFGMINFGEGPEQFCFHRYSPHRQYMVFIPIGVLESNHTTGTMVNVNDTLGINIVFSNNETGDEDLYCWQQWNESTNTTDTVETYFAFGEDEEMFNITEAQCELWGHLCIEGVNAATGTPEPDLDQINAGSSSGFTNGNISLLLIIAVIIIILLVVGVVLSKK